VDETIEAGGNCTGRQDNWGEISSKTHAGNQQNLEMQRMQNKATLCLVAEKSTSHWTWSSMKETTNFDLCNER
jgi:hypothetical protein